MHKHKELENSIKRGTSCEEAQENVAERRAGEGRPSLLEDLSSGFTEKWGLCRMV